MQQEELRIPFDPLTKISSGVVIEKLKSLVSITRNNKEPRESFGEYGLIETDLLSVGNEIAKEFKDNPKDNNTVETATFFVRLIRNLCAEVPLNQERIAKTGQVKNFVLPMIECSLTLYENEKLNNIIVFLRSAVQCCGNYITANKKNAIQLWGLIIPDFITRLLSLKDDTQLTDIVIMLLYNSIMAHTAYRYTLIQYPKVLHLLFDKIHVTSIDKKSEDQIFHSLYCFILKFCEEDLFPDLYHALGDEKQGTTESQLIILRLYDLISEKDNEQKNSTPKSCKFFVKVLGSLYNIDFSRGEGLQLGNKPGSFGKKNVDINNNNNNNEQDGLNISGPASQVFPEKTDSIQSVQTTSNDQTTQTTTTKSELVETPTSLTPVDFEAILYILQILGNISSHYKEDISQGDSRESLRKNGLLGLTVATLHGIYSLDQKLKEKRAGTTSRAADIPGSSPYGFKRELVRILANMAFRSKVAQDEMRDLGAIPIILNSCVLDDNNPYLKEWAVLGIRNLCENNTENQEVVKNMRILGAAENKELAELGVKVEIENGKLKVTKLEQEEKTE